MRTVYLPPDHDTRLPVRRSSSRKVKGSVESTAYHEKLNVMPLAYVDAAGMVAPAPRAQRREKGNCRQSRIGTPLSRSSQRRDRRARRLRSGAHARTDVEHGAHGHGLQLARARKVGVHLHHLFFRHELHVALFVRCDAALRRGAQRERRGSQHHPAGH